MPTSELSSLVSDTVKGELAGNAPDTKIPAAPPPKMAGEVETITGLTGEPDKTPETKTPETKTPETKAPETKAPETKKTLEVPESLLTTPEVKEPLKPEEPAPGSKESNLAQLRKRAEDQQKIIDDLTAFKAGIVGADGKVKPPPEIEAALKERDEQIKSLSETLERENFVKSPRFATEFQKPVDDAFARVVAVVKEFVPTSRWPRSLLLAG